MDTESAYQNLLAREKERTFFYAMNLMLLQKELNLSYKEARAFMTDKWEPPKRMAHELEMPIRSVYNMQNRVDKKLLKSGKTYEEIVGIYAMPNIVIWDG